MPYFYFGFAVVTLLACIYQAIMLNKYKISTNITNIVIYAV